MACTAPKQQQQRKVLKGDTPYAPGTAPPTGRKRKAGTGTSTWEAKRQCRFTPVWDDTKRIKIIDDIYFNMAFNKDDVPLYDVRKLAKNGTQYTRKGICFTADQAVSIIAFLERAIHRSKRIQIERKSKEEREHEHDLDKLMVTVGQTESESVPDYVNFLIE
jgi:hypothetical protein